MIKKKGNNTMKNTLKINFEKSLIIMDRTFAARCQNTNSVEYQHLQNVRRDYPEFKVIQREIKKNPNKETHAGLTYDYMERYILTHEPKETLKEVYDEYQELRLISQCHSKSRRYPVIKKWFLKQYPEITKFGMKCDNEVYNIDNAYDVA